MQNGQAGRVVAVCRRALRLSRFDLVEQAHLAAPSRKRPDFLRFCPAFRDGATTMNERPNTVAGLIEKRREIAGKIENLQGQLRQAVIDLDHIEAAIRIFRPDIDLGEVSPRRIPTAHHAFRGETSRVVLDALRASERPLSTLHLADAVMRHRGLDTSDKALRRTMTRRVGAVLRHWKEKGALRSMTTHGQPALWEMVD